jgi:hypothetical protein
MPGSASKGRSEMAGAAKTDAPSDLLDRQNRLICEKLLRRLHANTGQIAVGRNTDGLAERTLEMPSAHADELRELLQTNRVREAIVHVVDHEPQTTSRQSAESSARLS